MGGEESMGHCGIPELDSIYAQQEMERCIPTDSILTGFEPLFALQEVGSAALNLKQTHPQTLNS